MAWNASAMPAIRRSNQVYYEQVSERTTLDVGYAYFNRHFGNVGSCNFIGEVLLDPEVADPVTLVNQFFADQGVRCHAWVPAATQDPEAVAGVLAGSGFERRGTEVYALPVAPVEAAASALRIVGARAMRRAYEALVGVRREMRGADVQADAVQLERLNDPQYDAFVAMDSDRPVGMISVFQVGEIGRLCDFFVVPDASDQVGGALLDYAVATARRWLLSPICAQAREDETTWRGLLERRGFQKGGTIVAFCRPELVEIGG